MKTYRCIRICEYQGRIYKEAEVLTVKDDVESIILSKFFVLVSGKGESIMAEVKTGVETTEFKAAENASKWGIVAMILGVVTTMGSSLLPALGTNSKIGIIAGAVIACAGMVQKTLVQLGYIKGRSDVKVAASLEKK